MRKPTVFTLVIVLLFLATAGVQGSAAPAASRPTAYDYDPLTWTTVDGGGASFSTGGRYTLGLTSGQPDAGAAQGGRYTMQTGFWDGVAAAVLHQVFVPLTLKGYAAPTPDLVVESITATGNNVLLVLRNIGDGPALEPFWVDVYIDPSPPPSAVNQPWQSLASQGLVWGVTAPAMPLAPGAAVTLTVGDAYFWPDLSLVNWPLPAGTAVYAQVDSYNEATNYGAVRERHEFTGEPYNNILGPVYVVPLADEPPGLALPGGRPVGSWNGLPPRP